MFYPKKLRFRTQKAKKLDKVLIVCTLLYSITNFYTTYDSNGSRFIFLGKFVNYARLFPPINDQVRVISCVVIVFDYPFSV